MGLTPESMRGGGGRGELRFGRQCLWLSQHGALASVGHRAEGFRLTACGSGSGSIGFYGV